MVSTVTTSTVTSAAIAGSFAVIAILVLLALLIQKELFMAHGDQRFKDLGGLLNVAIAPLLIAFLLVVVAKVAEVLK